MSRAKTTLNEIDLHISNELWSTSVNRLYYACYYAVTALLVNQQIAAQTHSGVRHMFGLHFIKTNLIDREIGKFYTDIFDKRQTGDYDDYVTFSRDEVVSLIEPAKKLISEIERLLVAE